MFQKTKFIVLFHTTEQKYDLLICTCKSIQLVKILKLLFDGHYNKLWLSVNYTSYLGLKIFLDRDFLATYPMDVSF